MFLLCLCTCLKWDVRDGTIMNNNTSGSTPGLFFCPLPPRAPHEAGRASKPTPSMGYPINECRPTERLPPPSAPHTTPYEQHTHPPALRWLHETPAPWDRSSLPRFRMQQTHCRLWPWCKLVSVCRMYISRRRCAGRYLSLIHI